MIITTGGKNMSAARTFCILISLLALLVATFYIGCAPDRTGTAAPNARPEVFFVNTPPDSAQFSRNPELNWYATDIDGYIKFFRHAVVVDSMLLVNGEKVTPEQFAEQATDAQFGWDTLIVDLDHPQSTATIRLYANVDFPVDSFVVQHFFIQAQDDRNALSDIKWRMYSRNNHFPNTHFRSINEYINAPDPSSPAPGIYLNWGGADSTDWGRAEPPLEYEWRLYGPFNADDVIHVNLVKENCIYDPTADSFVNCIDVPVLDIENLPPAIGDMPQPLVHSKGPNFANDPSDVWVTETQTTIYNVFADLNLKKTSKYRFVFWVRARDDGFVPDPTPSFSQFFVYEAKFENSIMVIDETGYDTRNGRWGPKSINRAKAYFYNTIRAAGYEDFDTIWYRDIRRPKDYFYSAQKAGIGDTSYIPTDTGRPSPIRPELIDVLGHRVMVFYNDDAEIGPKEGEFGLLRVTYQGLDMGASAWMLARNLGNAGMQTRPGAEMGMSLTFSLRFGISMVVAEGWLYRVFMESPGNPRFNEQYIGAYSNIQGFPNLMVDYGEGSRLDTLYPRMFLNPLHVMSGLPEIGVGTRTAFATPAYLYLSKDGDLSFFHGKVNGVIQQLGDMRTACFMFTPLSIEPEPMQQVFNTVLPWLSEKFEQSPSPSLKSVTGYESGFSSIEERRSRIRQFLEYATHYATPEEKEAWGVGDLPPFEVTPTDVKITADKVIK